MFTIYDSLLKIRFADPSRVKSQNEQLAKVIPALKGIELSKMYAFDFNIFNEAQSGQAVGLDYTINKIALPYKHVYLESTADWNKNQIIFSMHKQAHRISGIYIYETSPTELEIVYQFDQLDYEDAVKGKTAVKAIGVANTNFFLNSVNTFKDETPDVTAREALSYIENTIAITTETNLKLDLIARWYVTYYLALLQRKVDVGYAKTKVKYKDRTGAKHVDKRPFRVLNLGTKQDRQYAERNIPYALEWKYKFMVRGHWRKINEQVFGKDREGNYDTKGYTWVSEHVRGDKDLPEAPNKPTLIKLPA